MVLIWVISGFSCLLCFSGVGAFGLFLTQPTSYLLGIYLLNKNQEKAKTPLNLNLIITFGLMTLIAVGLMSYP